MGCRCVIHVVSLCYRYSVGKMWVGCVEMSTYRCSRIVVVVPLRYRWVFSGVLLHYPNTDFSIGLL